MCHVAFRMVASPYVGLAGPALGRCAFLTLLLFAALLLAGCQAGKQFTKDWAQATEKFGTMTDEAFGSEKEQSQAAEPSRPVHRDDLRSVRLGDVLAVAVAGGDTPASLAKRYLAGAGGASEAWRIIEYNDLAIAPDGLLPPGTTVLVPLSSFKHGGVTPKTIQEVTVLSYHRFHASKRSSTQVRIADFRAQLAYLRDNGYTVVPLSRVVAFTRGEADLPEKAVAITVDDGWQSFLDLGWPVLKEFGYPATLFVYTDLIVGSRVTLSWEQVTQLAKDGVDIQCHTKTHRDMTRKLEGEDLTAYVNALREEILESRETIREKTGVQTTILAYPYGAVNPVVQALVREAGFSGAVTVNRGGSRFYTDPYRINRSMIFGRHDLEDFAKQLEVAHVIAD